MDVWTALKIAFRRWYVTVPVLVLAFVAAREVSSRQESTYETSASVVLVVPGTTVDSNDQPIDVNPYLSFSGSLNATASALSLVMSSVTKQIELQSQGLTAAYEVQQVGPVLTYSVTGEDASTVIGTAGALVAESQEELLDLQTSVDAPESQLIGIHVLANPRVAEETLGSGDRAFLAVLGVGIVAAISTALLLESIAVHRQRSRPQAEAGRRRRRSRKTGEKTLGPNVEELQESEAPEETATAETTPVASEAPVASGEPGEASGEDSDASVPFGTDDKDGRVLAGTDEQRVSDGEAEGPATDVGEAGDGEPSASEPDRSTTDALHYSQTMPPQ